MQCQGRLGDRPAVRGYYSITGVAREGPSIAEPLIHLRAKQTKRIDAPPDPAAGHYRMDTIRECITTSLCSPASGTRR